MSGKCYACAASFGFFKKEVGCKNCGFAFCKDCLTKKVPVPKRGNETHKVCNQCYTALTSGTSKPSDPAKYSPPAAYKKRIAALEKKPDKQHNRNVPTATPINYKGMDKKDIKIAERLQKLKDDRKKETGPVASQKEIEQRLLNLKADKPPAPSADEMAHRLAELKGQDPASVNKPHVFKKDTRPEQQQIDDLLSEINEEVDIDSHALNHLKGKDDNLPHSSHAPYPVPSISADYKSETGEKLDVNEMNNLMAQVAEEMDLDARKAIAGLEKDKELMARLGQLKQDRKERQATKHTEEGSTKTVVDSSELQDKYSHLQPEFSDSEDEEEAIKRIIKQSLEESLIDDAVKASGHSAHSSTSSSATGSKRKATKQAAKVQPPAISVEETSESDDFPWCCICNEDATLKCIGCDFDLYCKRCFKEGHDKLDMEDHTSIPFKPRKPKKSV